MKSLRKRWACFPLVLLLTIVLAACAAADSQDPVPEPGVTTLIYAKVSEDGVDRTWLENFNSEHKGEVQIEVRDYSQMSEGGRQGIDLLMTEIAAGKIPDIIELGTSGETSLLPYRQFAEKGYLEDLWPYIENDPELGRDAVIEAPLKTIEVNGGLYAIFESFWLHTLTASKSVVGDRTGWTVEELLEAFDAMPEGSIILDTYKVLSMREHLLSSFLYGFSDLFVDWENRQCAFDCETFRSILELVGRIPDEGTWQQNYPEKERYGEYNLRLREGANMLDDIGLGAFHHFGVENVLFDGASCVGYPVGDGSSGAYIEPYGVRLAMSSTCADKDAAWLYLRQSVFPRSSKYAYSGFPVNAHSYHLRKTRARREIYAVRMGKEYLQIDDPMTREQCEYVEALLDTPRSSLMLDKSVRDIVLETAGAYFAGDKTLDQTVQIIDSRVGLYLSEQQ